MKYKIDENKIREGDIERVKLAINHLEDVIENLPLDYESLSVILGIEDSYRHYMFLGNYLEKAFLSVKKKNIDSEEVLKYKNEAREMIDKKLEEISYHSKADGVQKIKYKPKIVKELIK